MYTILLTLVLNGNPTMSTVGSYDSEARCNEVKTIVLKSYVGTKFTATARCVPNK